MSPRDTPHCQIQIKPHQTYIVHECAWVCAAVCEQRAEVHDFETASTPFSG
jgi:hypothetical protein